MQAAVQGHLKVISFTEYAAHRLSVLIKVLSPKQPSGFRRSQPGVTPEQRVLVLSGESEISKVTQVTIGGQGENHVVCLPGTKTEGTKTFCPHRELW